MMDWPSTRYMIMRIVLRIRRALVRTAALPALCRREMLGPFLCPRRASPQGCLPDGIRLASSWGTQWGRPRDCLNYLGI